MAVGNERRFGTLAVVVAAPARLLTIFLGRCLPHIVNGTLAAVVVFVASGLVVDAGPGVGAVPRLALAGLCGAVACTGLGLAIGLAGLVLRDIWLAGNLATLATLILSGAVVPPAALWPALASAAPAVPLHNAIAVARGAPLPGLLLELAVGAALALITVVGLRLVERRARTTGALDLW
jgi:ABC-2 type transport system permease protein